MEKYKDKNDLTEISPVFAVWRMCNWIYLILCFIGLISSQWIGFLALIVLSLIPKKWFTWRIIDNILGIAILLFNNQTYFAMKDIMLADTPVEQRAQILRDSCDEVVEKSYLSKFSQEETNELRANLVEVQIQMQELTENFDVVKADFKGKMKPLQERIGKMLDDLRKGGEYIKGECYKFIDQDEGRVGYYTPDGYLLEERPMKPEERQKTIQMAVRLTGTDN